jgi:uncharacterized OB-fold protein
MSFEGDKGMEIVRCTQCQRNYIPPKYACPSCGGTRFKPSEIEGKGMIESFTTIWVAPEQHLDQVPYQLIVVKLDEALRVTGRLAGPAEGLAIGARVEFTEKNEIGYWFRLAKGKAHDTKR